MSWPQYSKVTVFTARRNFATQSTASLPCQDSELAGGRLVEEGSTTAVGSRSGIWGVPPAAAAQSEAGGGCCLSGDRWGIGIPDGVGPRVSPMPNNPGVGDGVAGSWVSPMLNNSGVGDEVAGSWVSSVLNNSGVGDGVAGSVLGRWHCGE